MRARSLLSFLNLAAMTATFVVWLAFPRYAQYAVYLALGWILIACALLYTSWAARPSGAAAAGSGGAGAAGGSPLPAAATAPFTPSAPIGFCIYCAASLPVGAMRCPACGHPVRIR